jgi:hypothetical protein
MRGERMNDERTTWAAELADAMGVEDPGPVIAYAPNEDAFAVPFDPGYGGAEGPPVLAWTATRVYFPVVYDGAEWLDSAPRNPQSEGQRHVGSQRQRGADNESRRH